MNFKKRVNGSWTDVPYYLHNTSTDTITTLPADIYANAATATVGLKGQTVQSGTPTPQNPVMPEGCGNMTGNLFNTFDIVGQVPSVTNGELVNSISGGTTSFILLSNPLVSLTLFSSTMQIYLFLYNENKTFIGYASSAGTVSSSAITGYTNAKYARIRSDKISLYDKNVTLVYGSTAPPSYIPYGYKIPILSANTTTPVYLGEVQTTRKIKKYEFTGEESINLRAEFANATAYSYTHYTDEALPYNTVPVICSHFPFLVSYGDQSDHIYQDARNFYITSTQYHTVEDFKAYLAQQYAAGTPVTVWYVLATEKTAVVNEPIRKIGDYADSVSVTNIPTTAGGIEFDVLTTLKPSEVSLTYTGWHDATVKEWDGSQWS